MDLFYGSTVEDQLRALKKDIKASALSDYGYDYGHKRLYLAFGNKENIGNNIMIVAPPMLEDSKVFDDANYKYLKEILVKYDILKFFLVPNFVIPKAHVSKADIKDYSKWIEKLIEIIQPKLVVVLGEDSIFSFFRRKFILRDFHGQTIGVVPSGQDIILTYSMDYYIERSSYEDPSFKTFILNNDWTIIAKRYKELIT